MYDGDLALSIVVDWMEADMNKLAVEWTKQFEKSGIHQVRRLTFRNIKLMSWLKMMRPKKNMQGWIFFL